MAVPVIKLNLAPPTTLWRQNHHILGWASLLLGLLALFAAGSVSLLAYRDARLAGEKAILSTEEAREVVRKQMAIQDRLSSIDVEKELPVWRLAERILGERSLPWSRLTAELERSLVQDVRLKSIQRTRDSNQSVELKIRGEAKSRIAEESFVESLHKNPFFSQVVLEREADRQGGGVEFEYTLPVSPAPPPYEALPKFGPVRAVQPPPVTVKPAVNPAVAPSKPSTSLPPSPPPAAQGATAPRPLPRPPSRPSRIGPGQSLSPPATTDREERP